MLAKEDFTFIVEKADERLKSQWEEEFYMKEAKMGSLHWRIANGPPGSRYAFYFRLQRKETSWPIPIAANCCMRLAFGKVELEATGWWKTSDESGQGFGPERYTIGQLHESLLTKRTLELRVTITVKEVQYERGTDEYHAWLLRRDLRTLSKQKGDVQFGSLYVHSSILMARSEYFQQLFSGGFSEAKSRAVDLSHLNPDEQRLLPLVVDYLYGADTAPFKKLSLEDSVTVYKLADMYLVRPLQELAVHQICQKIPCADRDGLGKVLQISRSMDIMLAANIKTAMSNRFDDLWSIMITI
jgi:hypothetical protein